MAILRKRALVHKDDLMAAGRRWQEVSNSQDHFDDFIMSPLLSRRLRYSHDYLDVPEVTVQRVNMLLGPHYKAVIKAWYIKNKYEEK